jgi:hypothetical protein
MYRSLPNSCSNWVMTGVFRIQFILRDVICFQYFLILNDLSMVGDHGMLYCVDRFCSVSTSSWVNSWSIDSRFSCSSGVHVPCFSSALSDFNIVGVFSDSLTFLKNLMICCHILTVLSYFLSGDSPKGACAY